MRFSAGLNYSLCKPVAAFVGLVTFSTSSAQPWGATPTGSLAAVLELTRSKASGTRRERRLRRAPDYLYGYALPNFYFHMTTAYNILRHNGVELGKGDFMGRP
jgi:hypothetical protein